MLEYAHLVCHPHTTKHINTGVYTMYKVTCWTSTPGVIPCWNDYMQELNCPTIKQLHKY